MGVGLQPEHAEGCCQVSNAYVLAYMVPPVSKAIAVTVASHQNAKEPLTEYSNCCCANSTETGFLRLLRPSGCRRQTTQQQLFQDQLRVRVSP